jgi:hypothetical protein
VKIHEIITWNSNLHSIQQLSLRHLIEVCVVYRRFRTDDHADLDTPMIKSTSLDRALVISSFVYGPCGRLFEIGLPAGAAAVSTVASSAYHSESGFFLDPATGQEFAIPRVCLTFYDFNLDRLTPWLILKYSPSETSEILLARKELTHTSID